MAERKDINDQTIDQPPEPKEETGQATVQSSDGSEKSTQGGKAEAVIADLTVDTTALLDSEASQNEGAKSPAEKTIDFGNPVKTFRLGEPADAPNLHAASTQEFFAEATKDVAGKQPAPQSSPHPTSVRRQAAQTSPQGSRAAVASEEKKPSVPVPRIPGYEVLDELGRGGMGVVFKARQTKLNRIVALKMVLGGAHAGSDRLARFAKEAEAVASLHHPNIVQIYEVGEFEGMPFFSLEFVSGGMLSHKIGGKPRPPREAAETLTLLAAGMAAAHDIGIVHRDLKPGNILLTPDGTPKITDFGLAKRLEEDSSQTKSGTLMGSPSYMSPEQARGDTHEIGRLSDLYSLGAILYEMLTGRPPFVGPSVLETLMLVRHQEPVPPTRLQPKCPRDLETICLKCLQKEPSKRYASCQKLADDLHHFLAGEPIEARPVGWAEHFWRWCKRNPRVATLSASVVVLMLAVIVTLGFMAARMNREREALAKTRENAGQRLEQATRSINGGNYQQAQDILRWSDPLLSHADLADVRSGLETLGAQVNVFADFRKLLDSARFACRSGTRRQRELGREYCHKLLALYDEIEGRSGRGASGMPPLSNEQLMLFKEDVFEALLMAALVERELAVSEGKASQQKAAAKAIDWLNRAEQVVPGTRALPVHRAPCWAELGDSKGEAADLEKAKGIPPVLAVDHFWHGFAHHLRGDKALAEKDKQTAVDFYHQEIAEYAAFLRERPEHFWGYFNWANAHVQVGSRDDLHDAIIGFTACIRLGPDFPWPYNNRGTVHLRLGQYEMAVQDFSAAIKRDPNYPEAYSNRGLANVALKKPDLAIDDLTKAISLNPEAKEAYTARAEIYRERKQDALAVEDYTRLLSMTENKAPILEKRAALYRSLKQSNEAILDYGELIKLNPKDLQAMLSRAQLFLAEEKYAEARADFTAIIEKAPASVKIVRARAILNWQNLREFDAALADFERFAQLSPKDAEPYRCIGAILLNQRKYPEALDAFQKALGLRPGYPRVVWAKSQIHMFQGKGEEALKELNPLTVNLPDGAAETFNVRAGVYTALGKFNEAAADYQRMIELKPKEPEAYVCLARIYDKQGQKEKAAKCLDQLVEAAPETKWAHLRRAEFHRDRGQFDAAEADCKALAALAPDWHLAALVRASITAARANATAAVAQAEAVMAKAPHNDGQVLYAAACTWSLAAANQKDSAKSKRLAETAADYLDRALGKGLQDLSYSELHRVSEDPALSHIRQMPKVRDLLDMPGVLQLKK